MKDVTREIPIQMCEHVLKNWTDRIRVRYCQQSRI